MCGIIGYVGSRNASEVITEGLKRLEYRGYDSVGMAILGNNGLELKKDKGMVEEVSSALNFVNLEGTLAIGHTRWATHGSVCKENAHPHQDCTKKVVLAHNGVIENYAKIKDWLILSGHKFISETDSEVIAHLIEENLKTEKPLYAFLKSLRMLRGSYAIVCIILDGSEQKLYLARRNSPLTLGIGKGEMLCASDIPAMLPYTKTFVPMEEGDVAVLSKNGYKFYSLDGLDLQRNSLTVDWSPEMAQKGGFAHFMLKEIYDQKHYLNDTLVSDVSTAKALIENFERIDILACGSSYHAGLLFSYLLQEKGKCAQAYIASDYPFIRKPDSKTLIFAISQSGETADLLQAMRYAKERGVKMVAITNVVGSSIISLANHTILTNSGPEVGVAATKSFSAQLAIIYKIIYGKERLCELGGLINQSLSKEAEVKSLAIKLVEKQNVFFIARGNLVPIAYEGSLKFKEITYIHSEAYPGGELKHGTLSLITPGVPLIVLAPKDETVSKLFGNLKEAKARGGYIISITDVDTVARESDESIFIPAVSDPILYPFAMVVLLQFLAYHVSVLRGINPDRPRNLAKSVTVE